MTHRVIPTTRDQRPLESVRECYCGIAKRLVICFVSFVLLCMFGAGYLPIGFWRGLAKLLSNTFVLDVPFCSLIKDKVITITSCSTPTDECRHSG